MHLPSGKLLDDEEEEEEEEEEGEEDMGKEEEPVASHPVSLPVEQPHASVLLKAAILPLALSNDKPEVPAQPITSTTQPSTTSDSGTQFSQSSAALEFWKQPIDFEALPKEIQDLHLFWSLLKDYVTSQDFSIAQRDDDLEMHLPGLHPTLVGLAGKLTDWIELDDDFSQHEHRLNVIRYAQGDLQWPASFKNWILRAQYILNDEEPEVEAMIPDDAQDAHAKALQQHQLSDSPSRFSIPPSDSQDSLPLFITDLDVEVFGATATVRESIVKTCGKHTNVTRKYDLKPRARSSVWSFFDVDNWFLVDEAEALTYHSISQEMVAGIVKAINDLGNAVPKTVFAHLGTYSTYATDPQIIEGWLTKDELRILPIGPMLWWRETCRFVSDEMRSVPSAGLLVETLADIRTCTEKMLEVVCEPAMRKHFDEAWTAVSVFTSASCTQLTVCAG
jgi:hypothetical protein